jgi:DNA modification methylase
VNEPTEQTRGIDTLVPHPRNYNQHPPEQIARIAKSLVRFGQVRPIVVHRDTIIAGHGVYMAAQHLNYQTLRVTQLPDDWTDEQAMAYLVADNETRRGAEPSDTELAALLDELQQADFDIAAMGFDEQEYSALLDGLTPDLPEPGDGGDEFEPDEAAPCRVQAGDVWLIGGVHRLICGDCTDPATVERLMQGERADAVVTDPPYGVKRDKGFGGFGGFGPPIARRQYDDNWDSERPDGEVFQFLLRCADKSIIFGGNFFADLLPQGKHWIVWDKNNTMPTFGDCELAWTNVLRTSVKKYAIEYNGLIGKEKERWHPTQKPVALFHTILQDYTEGDALILDPFLGSGTTIIAAHRTGRRCYGCEISEAYCEIILQRCEAEGLTVERVEQA